MSQVTIYLEEDTLKKIGLYSKMENLSVSKWVKKCILKTLDDKLQPGYFSVFGSLADDESFSRPPQESYGKDLPRESL